MLIGLACIPLRTLAEFVAKGTATTRSSILHTATFSVSVHFAPPSWIKGNKTEAQTPPISTKQSRSPLACPSKTSFGISRRTLACALAKVLRFHPAMPVSLLNSHLGHSHVQLCLFWGVALIHIAMLTYAWVCAWLACLVANKYSKTPRAHLQEMWNPQEHSRYVPLDLIREHPSTSTAWARRPSWSLEARV